MRVFLTGGSGFVGSWTVPALLDAGHEPTLLVRSVAKANDVLGRRGVGLGKVELVPGDMTDATAVRRAARGCDATIHTAAAVGVTSGGQVSVFDQNTIGARNVVTAALDDGHDPVVHVSSISAFVPPVTPLITTESRLAEPKAEYGRSKVATERELRALQDEGAPITIVYPGGIFGPDQPTLDSAAEGIAGARRQGWPITSGGTTVLDVRDLAEVLVRCLTPGVGPRRYMLGGTFFPWADLGALIDGITGVRARRLPLPKPVLYGMANVLDLVRRVRPISYPLTVDAAEMMTKMVPTDDSATLRELGVELRPPRETLEDTVRWLAAAGHLQPEHAGRLAP